VTFTGPIVKVTKKVTFENKDIDRDVHKSPQDWLDLRRVEADLNKEVEKTVQICRACKAAE